MKAAMVAALPLDREAADASPPRRVQLDESTLSGKHLSDLVS